MKKKNNYSWNLSSTHLAHHGVKGQKWGVRNGPPYPIEDKVMKAGTRLNSLEMVDQKLIKGLFGGNKGWENDREAYDEEWKDRWLYTYNPDDDWDRKVYTGPFATFKVRDYMFSSKYKKPFETSYEVTKDLRLADSSERYTTFKTMYNRFGKEVNEDLKIISKKYQDVIDEYGSDYAPISDKDKSFCNNVDLDSTKHSEVELQQMYSQFNKLMERSDMFKTTKLYAKAMQDNFDGMVDDNNVNHYNAAHDPVIIFNRDAVKKVSSRELDSAEINANYNYIEEELKKVGKVVML